MTTNAADFQDIPFPEKLRLVTELWDQIASDRQPPQLAKSIVEQAVRRIDEMIADPSIGIDEDEMWRRADAKR